MFTILWLFSSLIPIITVPTGSFLFPTLGPAIPEIAMAKLASNYFNTPISISSTTSILTAPNFSKVLFLTCNS